MTVYRKSWRHAEKTCGYACRNFRTKLKLPHFKILKHKKKQFLTHWDKNASTVERGATGQVYLLSHTVFRCSKLTYIVPMKYET